MVYLILVGGVFTLRDHPGIRSRSPTLIIVGGCALLLDSMMNFFIQLSEDNLCQCFIGIFTTVVFHYTAWFSIFLRAFRIGRFFDIYEKYLDKAENEQLQMSYLRLTLPVDMDSSHEEETMLSEFQKLKESNFLKKHMLIFISVITVIGMSTFYYPNIYAIVPVYETDQCQSYFQSYTVPAWIYDMNIYSYLVINWCELLFLVLICFKIRNVKDELSIITELLWISGSWIICSFFYFLMFNFKASAQEDGKFLLSWGIFLTIQLRNLSTMVISATFCIHVVKSPSLVYTAEDFTSLTTLLDFELVMMSVIPYSYFKKFVLRQSGEQARAGNEQQREGDALYPVYLKLYTTIEMMQAKQRQIKRLAKGAA